MPKRTSSGLCTCAKGRSSRRVGVSHVSAGRDRDWDAIESPACLRVYVPGVTAVGLTRAIVYIIIEYCSLIRELMRTRMQRVNRGDNEELDFVVFIFMENIFLDCSTFVEAIIGTSIIMTV